MVLTIKKVLVGLVIELMRFLVDRLMVDVVIKLGTYVSEVAVNKQLADKEKVVRAMLDQCLETQARGE